MFFYIIFGLFLNLNTYAAITPIMYSHISHAMLLDSLISKDLDKIFTPLHSDKDLKFMSEYDFMVICHKSVFENY